MYGTSRYNERRYCVNHDSFQADQEVNEENVGVSIDGCECYNFKKIHATIQDSVEQSCPSERLPKNGVGWLPYRRIYYAYAMCYYRRRQDWCRWWRILASQQAAIVNGGGIPQIPTRPIRPGATGCMFCATSL